MSISTDHVNFHPWNMVDTKSDQTMSVGALFIKTASEILYSVREEPCIVCGDRGHTMPCVCCDGLCCPDHLNDAGMCQQCERSREEKS